ncbi:MAG: hypothetical protein K2X25_13655 [Caulobacteraceae bacterium]|nr:hypothetical protein [Caulobacteraceae bacterium]
MRVPQEKVVLGCMALLAVLYLVDSFRDNRREQAVIDRDEERVARVELLNAEAETALAKAQQTGSRADFDAAQRAADRLDGAIRVMLDTDAR